MIEPVLSAYGFDLNQTNAAAFGKGLINSTWRVTSGGKSYILQRINDAVFKHPRDIAENIRLIGEYLTLHHPAYNFVAPVKAVNGDDIVFIQGKGYYRMFPFVESSHAIDVVKTPEQAYEAARQFGRFTKLLSGVDMKKLKITIPDFHNLSFRYEQFEDALENGNQQRISESKQLIDTAFVHSGIVKTYEKLKTNPTIHLRVTHHDTKISNVLFDTNDKGLCVIDLDTVMPGYFISDVGDMMRTYLSPVSEEEEDPDKIEVRGEFYAAVARGYLAEMKGQLTEREKEHFYYAGKFMTYMQAIRFLADYVKDDIYYGARYPKHNLTRAANQFRLLELLVQQEETLSRMTRTLNE